MESSKTMYAEKDITIENIVALQSNFQHGLIDENICTSAARYGLLDSLEYAHKNGCPCDFLQCKKYAMEYGHTECLRYAHMYESKWPRGAISDAAANGYLSCIKFARENGCQWEDNYTDNSACTRAAMNGHLHCLRFANDNGCRCDSHTILYAGMNGHLDCLKYSIKHSRSIPGDVCMYTAARGHLECLQYLIENDFSTIFVCKMAARYGHIKCLECAHTSGRCSWDNDTLALAVANRHYDCFSYAIRHGCPYNTLFSPLSTPPIAMCLAIAYVKHVKLYGKYLYEGFRAKRSAYCILRHMIAWRARTRIALLKEELMRVAWHPRRFIDWCWDEDEKREFISDCL